ncbi:MAG: HlyD family efflux transporter periplasmic adaptor subunit [Rhizomicrobium sp.]|jgi:membrane fusion protein (multidrug efflux system)
MSEAQNDNARSSTRRRALFGVGALVLLGLVVWGAYWLLYARYFQSTDDAYVSGDIVAVTARDPGTVLALHADNTQWVTRGQLLVELDPASAKIALQSAEADLGHTVRQVSGLFAKADELRAVIAQAHVQLSQAQADYARRAQAVKDGAVSQEDLTHSQDALANAKNAVSAAQSQLDQTLSQIRGTTVATNPDVLAAEARLRNAMLTLDHMRITSPVDGSVAQRSVQLGEQIAAGTPLMAVVPLNDVWIDANFKEVQLSRMRIGQPVKVTADMYGGGVTFHGRVVGLSAGSGAAFALLPPQNASGNWIKIVQRVPVRIALDPNELKDHPLRVGLSVNASVDVRDQSGPQVAAEVRKMIPAPETGDKVGEANALIAEIVAANQSLPDHP